MQISSVSGFRASLAAAAMFAALAGASAASAEERAEAQLIKPVATPVEKIVDGRIWRCDGDLCVGATSLSTRQPLKRECQRAARALGQFVTYSSGGRSLDGDSLKACNAG